MRAMVKTTRFLFPVLVLSAITGLATCNKPRTTATVPGLALRAPGEARADLVAEILLPSAERTLASGAAIAKRLQLPFGEADLRTMLLARSGLAAGLLERVDLSKPAAAAVIVTGGKQDAGQTASTVPVLAFALKDTSQAGFDAFVAAAGTPAKGEKDAVQVQMSDGGAKAFWLLLRDGAVVAADSLDALVAGGGLALEARRSVSQDVLVTVLPDGIARSSGTTVKESLGQARNVIRLSAAPGVPPGKETKQQVMLADMSQAMTGWMFDAVAGTDAARIGFSVDASKGLSTAVELVPRPGSAFAKTAAVRHAYAIDPSLLAGSPAMLWSAGDMTFARTMFDAFRAPLLETLKAPADRAKASAAIDGLWNALAGPFSARFAYEGEGTFPMTYDLVYALKPGTNGKQLLVDLETMMASPVWKQLLETNTPSSLKVKHSSKREGDVLVTQMSVAPPKAAGKRQDDFKGMPFLDGTPMVIRTVVAGDRLVVSLGEGATVRQKAWLAQPIGAAPAGDLATALAETKGHDSFWYADLAGVFKPILALASIGGLGQAPGGPNPMAMADMASAMLQNAQLATWGSVRGGTTLTLDWRIPMSTMESIAGIARGAMGGAP